MTIVFQIMILILLRYIPHFNICLSDLLMMEHRIVF